MRWQKILRFAIAIFVVGFAALLAVSFRRGGGRKAGPPPLVKKMDDKAIVQGGPGQDIRMTAGKVSFEIKFDKQLTYEDGRNKLIGHVHVMLPDRGGRQVIVESDEAETTTPPGKQIGTAVFKGNVKLTTNDGITIRTA